MTVTTNYPFFPVNCRLGFHNSDTLLLSSSFRTLLFAICRLFHYLQYPAQVTKKQSFFCDGTRRYGVPAPFFPSKEKQLFVMYIVNE